MISKALRPAGRQSAKLKQISHLYLSAPDTLHVDEASQSPAHDPAGRLASPVAAGLISLCALWLAWGYHYWQNGHSGEEVTAVPVAVINASPQTAPQQVASAGTAKVAQPVAPPPTAAAAIQPKAEQADAPKQTRNQASTYPQPYYRPHPAWRPPYYRGYPQPRYPYPPPAPYFRNHRTAATVIR